MANNYKPQYSITYFLVSGKIVKYRTVKPGEEYKLMDWVTRKIGPVKYGNVYDKQLNTFIFQIKPVSP